MVWKVSNAVDTDPNSDLNHLEIEVESARLEEMVDAEKLPVEFPQYYGYIENDFCKEVSIISLLFPASGQATYALLTVFNALETICQVDRPKEEDAEPLTICEDLFVGMTRV